MSTTPASFEPFAARMRDAALSEIAIRNFAHYYAQLVAGQTGLIPERSLTPVETLPDMETLPDELCAVGRAAMSQSVMIKLNGGLGTSMGMDRAKSLLQVRPGLSFLEIIARQTSRAGVPLVLMNSFSTHQDSIAALSGFRQHDARIPLDFVQHKVPKILLSDLSPATWPAEPDLEWAPPGHGDLYVAILTSGTLGTLLDAGYRYAFVSNADNLGALMEPRILGYLIQQGAPFLMEVADRTAADRKGGHLARRRYGQLILRESAQCAEEDRGAFGDVARHKYFNTNNLWIDLDALSKMMAASDNFLQLPMIRNSKNLDPRDSTSPMVYQLETAMGAAISLFRDAGALRVPRGRFAPVKTSEDLLALRSDAYLLTEDHSLLPNPERRGGQLLVTLDPRYYRLIDELEERFPFGAPSMLHCDSLRVEGDVEFGRNVTCAGDVEIISGGSERKLVPDGTCLEGRLVL